MLSTSFICDKIMKNYKGCYIQSFVEFNDYYAMSIVSKNEDTSSPYYYWAMVPFITIDKTSGDIINDEVYDVDLPVLEQTFKQLEIPKKYRRESNDGSLTFDE